MSTHYAATTSEVRSREEIDQLRAQRGGLWPTIRAIRGRRPLFTAILVVVAPLHTIFAGVPVYDLLGEDRSWRFFTAWSLIVLGVFVRLWGSGNLRKNQEITNTGVYRIVRHPLYVGSLAFFLAFFLTVTDPAIGVTLFVILVGLVYYPTMLAEEEYLALKFPAVAAGREYPWRLIPNLRFLREAFASDRFTLRSAWNNLGFRSAWFIVALPAFLRLLRWVQGAI
jgi:protein-S-isoprenylcysteine O-methyltransferase Ste14